MGYFATITIIYWMKNELWSEREQAFRDALREIRKSAGFNQKQFAQLLGKPQSFVSKYESGERQLRYQEIEVICSVCGTSLSEFSKTFALKYPLEIGVKYNRG